MQKKNSEKSKLVAGTGEKTACVFGRNGARPRVPMPQGLRNPSEAFDWLPPDVAKGALAGRWPFLVTPYYLDVLRTRDPKGELLRTVLPSSAEWQAEPAEMEDPLGEEAHRVAPCVIHTYPGKVLFLATDRCAVYCRYCTRARRLEQGGCSTVDWQQGLRYIREHRDVRDVLISGGDPLLLSDARLEFLLTELRAIPHVELIRIGSKMPAVLPQRITPALCDILRRSSPLWMVLHFTHPAELTSACAQACARLADAGLPLASQTVLLRGVNDRFETLRDLFEGLLRLRVRPYYLLQCDAIAGASRFRVPVRRGQELIRRLHGNTTGLAVPTYMIDAPGGGGKVPITPSAIEEYDGTWWYLRNAQGKTYRYYDPDDCGGDVSAS
jgi:lysine 2,3-aminomutase